MRVIIDECLPRRLKRLLVGVDVSTVPEAGFAGMKNGKLLAEISGHFEAFITMDSNLPYQQNLTDLPFAIIVIHAKSNRYPDLEPFSAELASAVKQAQPGRVIHVPLQA